MAVAFDTAAWNLGTVLVLAACGPQVPFDAGTEGGTDEVTTRGSSEGPQPQCRVDADCPEGGYVCKAGECVYECLDGCCDDDCCLGECGPYYECYIDDDCSEPEICTYGSCGPVPELEQCPTGLVVSEALPIDVELSEVISLAFVRMHDHPGEALVAASDFATLVRHPSGELELGGPVGAMAIAVGDVDGDADQDLVLLGEAIEVFRQREPEEIAGDAFEGVQTLDASGATALALADYDADGVAELFVSGSDGLLLHESDGVSFGEGTQLDANGIAPTAVFDGNVGQAAIAYQSEQVYVATASSGTAIYRTLPERGASPFGRRLYASDLDGDLRDDVIGVHSIDGRTFASAWWGAPDDWYPARWSSAGELTLGGAGDFDLDGREDLVVGGPGGLALMMGGEVSTQGDTVTSLARCVTWLDAPLPISALAVGDDDADGVPEIAITDGVSVILIRLAPG